MGGRTRRRHVGLEARTLPTLSGCKSRRERFGSPAFWPCPWNLRRLALPGEGVCESGGGGGLRHPRGRGEPRGEHQTERIGASGCPLRLRSLSEASGQSSRRLFASVSPPVKWSWAFLPHPFLRWGPGRPGSPLKGRCLTRRRSLRRSRREGSGGLGLSVSFLLAPLCHPNRPLQLLVPRKSWK